MNVWSSSCCLLLVLCATASRDLPGQSLSLAPSGSEGSCLCDLAVEATTASNPEASGLLSTTTDKVALLRLIDTDPIRGRGNPNPGIIPPHAIPLGMSYEEWIANYLNWAFKEPLERSPLTDLTGEFGGLNQPERVQFLAEHWDLEGTGRPARRRLSVRTGRSIWIPAMSSLAVRVNGESDEVLIAEAKRDADLISVLQVYIDGEPVEDLIRYRVASGIQELELPKGAILDQVLGYWGRFRAAADGYFLMVKPLSPGEHCVRIRGMAGSPKNPIRSVDVRYHLEVGDQRIL